MVTIRQTSKLLRVSWVLVLSVSARCLPMGHYRWIERHQLQGLHTAINYADKYFSKAVKRRRYPKAGRDERINRLSGGLDYCGFNHADVVIEAVPEILELKQKMALEIEDNTQGAIFATNTSSLPITEIAEKATHPERIGMHFLVQ